MLIANSPKKKKLTDKGGGKRGRARDTFLPSATGGGKKVVHAIDREVVSSGIRGGERPCCQINVAYRWNDSPSSAGGTNERGGGRGRKGGGDSGAPNSRSSLFFTVEKGKERKKGGIQFADRNQTGGKSASANWDSPSTC